MFEARPENGQIQVMPVLALFELGEVADQDFVGPIPPWRHQLRKQRMQDIQKVPDAVAIALPGALASELPANWSGHFQVGHFPGAVPLRLTRALPLRPSLRA